MSLTNCHFYEEKYPEIESVVIATVTHIGELGAYAKLLEYDDLDGMILHSELSRRRIRSIHNHVRVGRNEAVVVVRVDKEKGYIDLSKRRVSPEDILKCEERYNKSKMVHGILRQVAEKTNTPIKELYQDIGWPLNKRYGHAVEAFKLSFTKPEVWQEVTFRSDGIRDELLANIKKRLTPQPTKVRADIELTCFEYAGIEAIKRALRCAETKSSEQRQVKAKVVSSPLYVLTVHTIHQSDGIEVLNDAIRDIDATIRGEGGKCVIKMAPRAVSENDDAELQALMDKRERENQEVSGDEYESASD